MEDCSECCDGGSYHGSTHADVRFFSFGTIKTSTALGGGIALLRTDDDHDNPNNNKIGTRRVGGEENETVRRRHVERPNDETARGMRRLQDTLYAPQSRREYFFKVLKCCSFCRATHRRAGSWSVSSTFVGLITIVW